MRHLNKFTVTPRKIVVAGHKDQLRRVVGIDIGVKNFTYVTLLTETHFLAFLKMAEAAYVEDSEYVDGFVPYDELFPGSSEGARRVSVARLRSELVAQTESLWEEPIETLPYKKRARLNIDSQCVLDFDIRKLVTYPNPTIRASAENIARWRRRMSPKTRPAQDKNLPRKKESSPAG